MITITAQSTKKEALVACHLHWQWLADNPGKDKDDWPELDPSTRDDCYCCEYMSNQPVSPETLRLDCKNCPLSGYAWEAAEWPACTKGESFYLPWSDLIIEKYSTTVTEEMMNQISAATQKMVDACTRALEDLG